MSRQVRMLKHAWLSWLVKLEGGRAFVGRACLAMVLARSELAVLQRRAGQVWRVWCGSLLVCAAACTTLSMQVLAPLADAAREGSFCAFAFMSSASNNVPRASVPSTSFNRKEKKRAYSGN